MIDVNGMTERFTSDKLRLVQLGSLVGFAAFLLLATFWDSKIPFTIVLITLAALVFLTVAPIYLMTVSANDSPLQKTGHIGLRAAEGAGLAGMALTVALLCTALGVLFEQSGASRKIDLVVLVLLVQAIVCTAIAVGVGLTNVLRSADVVLDSPPPPKARPVPQAAPHQAYQQPADQQQAYAQQQQAYAQQQQAYAQQQHAPADPAAAQQPQAPAAPAVAQQQQAPAAPAAAAPAPAAPASAAPAPAAQPSVQPPAWPTKGGEPTGGDQSGS